MCAFKLFAQINHYLVAYVLIKGNHEKIIKEQVKVSQPTVILKLMPSLRSTREMRHFPALYWR
jgi:hypothetical protein